MSGYIVEVNGLADVIGDLEELPPHIRKNAKLAVNATLRRSRTSAAKNIMGRANFGAGYLDQGNRLAIASFASDNNLSGSIKARDRATSLARFSTASPDGVMIEVNPGVARRSKRAFVIKLRAGKAAIETKFNLGLAIRLKEGETISNKRKMLKLSKGLYLLYGPSVAQFFEDVADETAPRSAEYLEQEFLRLMEL